MPNAPTFSRIAWRYLVLTWLALLVNTGLYFREVEFTGAVIPFFAGAVWLTYTIMYLLPFGLTVLGLGWIADRPIIAGLLRRVRLSPGVLLYPAAVLLLSLLQVLVFADRFIFRLWGFHVNGFVWDLLTARGGIESLGGSTSTTVSFALIIAGFVVLQVILLMVAIRWRWLRRPTDAMLARRWVALNVLLIMLAGGFERIAYGISSLRDYTPVLVGADAFPLYMPVTFADLARRLGYKAHGRPELKVKLQAMALHYPAKPIERTLPEKPLNIVWLVAESLRADALNPEVMPQTWAFSQQARRFTQHYSGGNGTRAAMFSMFYGLYATYWFSFLDQNRGPVLMDELIAQHYQMKLFTSAKFTYPEFDKTIFARVPAELLREGDAQPKWRRDRENVDQLLSFIDGRDPARPFMTFMFFESPHANYYFPEENIIRRPYAKDLNYATMDLKRDIGLMKARYDNACNHLDAQHARIFKHLRDRGLLDSTLVIVTGDHGEEFMEKGHWGHNRGYSREQITVPLVIWVPGRPAGEVGEMTSHLDLPATIMPLLGVTNPPGDYSQGFDLLGKARRTFAVLCDWNTICVLDGEYKASFPMSGYGFRDRKITASDDSPAPNAAAYHEARRDQLMTVMKQLNAFGR